MTNTKAVETTFGEITLTVTPVEDETTEETAEEAETPPEEAAEADESDSDEE